MLSARLLSGVQRADSPRRPPEMAAAGKVVGTSTFAVLYRKTATQIIPHAEWRRNLFPERRPSLVILESASLRRRGGHARNRLVDPPRFAVRTHADQAVLLDRKEASRPLAARAAGA